MDAVVRETTVRVLLKMNTMPHFLRALLMTLMNKHQQIFVQQYQSLMILIFLLSPSTLNISINYILNLKASRYGSNNSRSHRYITPSSEFASPIHIKLY
jgi:hypothetical protein